MRQGCGEELTLEFASDEIGSSAQDRQAPSRWTRSPFPLSRSLGLATGLAAGAIQRRRARNLCLGALVEAVRDHTRSADLKQVNRVLLARADRSGGKHPAPVLFGAASTAGRVRGSMWVALAQIS